MKILIALLLLFSCSSVEAKPRIADWKFWVHNGANVGVSLLTTYTINRCIHDHGLGVCIGGDYGSFPAKEAIRNSISLSSFWTSYEWKKTDEQRGNRHRLWYLIPDANAAFNGIVILRNRERHFGPKDTK